MRFDHFNNYFEGCILRGATKLSSIILVEKITTAKVLDMILKRVADLSHFEASYLTANATCVDEVSTKMQKETLEYFRSGKVHLSCFRGMLHIGWVNGSQWVAFGTFCKLGHGDRQTFLVKLFEITFQVSPCKSQKQFSLYFFLFSVIKFVLLIKVFDSKMFLF